MDTPDEEPEEQITFLQHYKLFANEYLEAKKGKREKDSLIPYSPDLDEDFLADQLNEAFKEEDESKIPEILVKLATCVQKTGEFDIPEKEAFFEQIVELAKSKDNVIHNYLINFIEELIENKQFLILSMLGTCGFVTNLLNNFIEDYQEGPFKREISTIIPSFIKCNKLVAKDVLRYSYLKLIANAFNHYYKDHDFIRKLFTFFTAFEQHQLSPQEFRFLFLVLRDIYSKDEFAWCKPRILYSIRAIVNSKEAANVFIREFQGDKIIIEGLRSEIDTIRTYTCFLLAQVYKMRPLLLADVDYGVALELSFSNKLKYVIIGFSVLNSVADCGPEGIDSLFFSGLCEMCRKYQNRPIKVQKLAIMLMLKLLMNGDNGQVKRCIGSSFIPQIVQFLNVGDPEVAQEFTNVLRKLLFTESFQMSPLVILAQFIQNDGLTVAESFLESDNGNLSEAGEAMKKMIESALSECSQSEEFESLLQMDNGQMIDIIETL